MERVDCCTTITCYDTPSAKLTTGASSACIRCRCPRACSRHSAPRLAPLIARTFTDASAAARGGERLAVLSILLI